jgi:hypothetical protein
MLIGCPLVSSSAGALYPYGLEGGVYLVEVEMMFVFAARR